jgi:hypothetical protein
MGAARQLKLVSVDRAAQIDSAGKKHSIGVVIPD